MTELKSSERMMRAMQHIATLKEVAEISILNIIQGFEEQTTLEVDSVFYFKVEVADYQGSPPPPVTRRIILRLRNQFE